MLTPSIGGILVHIHTQSSAASTWVINHNLGSKPLVELFVFDSGSLKKAWPLSLAHNDDNTVTVTWSQPRTGQATCASNQLV